MSQFVRPFSTAAAGDKDRVTEQNPINVACEDGAQKAFYERQRRQSGPGTIPLGTLDEAKLIRQTVACVSNDQPSPFVSTLGGKVSRITGPPVFNSACGMSPDSDFRVLGVMMSVGPEGDAKKAGNAEPSSVKVHGTTSVYKGGSLGFRAGDYALVMLPSDDDPFVCPGFGPEQKIMRLVPYKGGTATEVFGTIADEVAQAVAPFIADAGQRLEVEQRRTPRAPVNWADADRAVAAVEKIAERQFVPAAAAYAWACLSLYGVATAKAMQWTKPFVTPAGKTNMIGEVSTHVADAYARIAGGGNKRRPVDASYAPSKRRKITKTTTASFGQMKPADTAGCLTIVALVDDFNRFLKSRILGRVMRDSPPSNTMVDVEVGRRS